MLELSEAVSVLSESCASSGLILAMHHIQVATILRHASTAAQDELLPRIAAGGSSSWPMPTVRSDSTGTVGTVSAP